jgi:hypothetical protein
LACGASAAIIATGVGLGGATAFASPAPAHTSTAGNAVISNHPGGAPGWSIHASTRVVGTADTGAAVSARLSAKLSAETASTPPWRAQQSSSARPATCSNNYWVDANGVRIHKWPLLSAPTVGLAYYGQHVDVLDFYSDGWAKIGWRGTEEWMSSRYLVNDGLC